MAIRIDKLNDLRESVTYLVSFDKHHAASTINCSTLVGNSASLSIPRIELLGFESSLSNAIKIENCSASGTDYLSLAIGIGSSRASFYRSIEDGSSDYSSVVKITPEAQTSGYVLITFRKKQGFEDIGLNRRKMLRNRPYR